MKFGPRPSRQNEGEEMPEEGKPFLAHHFLLILAVVLVVALLISVFPALPKMFALFRTIRNETPREDNTMALFREDHVRSLFSDRHVSQILLPAGEPGDAYYAATVRIQYGVDIDKMTLERVNGVLVAALPDPELLDLEIDWDTLRLIPEHDGPEPDEAERAGLQQRFEDAAIEFMVRGELLPSRLEMVGRLNDFARLHVDYHRIRIVFR